MMNSSRSTTGGKFNMFGGGPSGGRERRPGFGRERAAKPLSEFDSKLLDLARVTRVTAGGKRMRFRAVIVAGNQKGKVGVGVAKGSDVQEAVAKATRQAKKYLIEVPIVNGTIPHGVFAKYGPAKIMLKPQHKGRGLVAGGTVRVICLLAGIKNISSKMLGRTSNKLNNARATIEALKKLKISVKSGSRPAVDQPKVEVAVQEEEKEKIS